MIPREAQRGRSFKGAGLYYLHDKDARTSERVAFTHTENLPTDDPDKAIGWMAATAIDAPALKRAAGVRNAGARSERPVYCFSLSWHPEEQPERPAMVEAGRQALAALGLSDHETLMIAHRDEAHPHLHLIVNLVHPENGRTNSLSYSRRTLSTWAENYERDQGKIYCEQRVENNAKRREQRQESVRHKDPELEQKALITQLYQESESGAAFQAALEEAGFTLAQGRRLVLIDGEGKMHSLTRQVEGVQAKAVREKLAGLILPEVSEARGRQEQEGREKGRTETRRPEPKETTETTRQKSAEESEPPRRNVPSRILNRLQDKHLTEMGRFYTETHSKQVHLDSLLNKEYGEFESGLRRDIKKLDETLQNTGQARLWWFKLTGRIPRTAEQDLENMRKSLANIEQRKSEARQKLEKEIARQREELTTKQKKEKEQVIKQAQENTHSSEQDFNRAALSEAANDNSRDTGMNRDIIGDNTPDISQSRG